MNDLRVMRSRHDDAAADLDAGGAGGDELGSAAFLAQTTTVSTYPTTAAVAYAVQPCDVQGVEQEGQAASYVRVTGPPLYAFNLGTAVPPAGTTLIVTAVGGRFVFRYDS